MKPDEAKTTWIVIDRGRDGQVCTAREDAADCYVEASDAPRVLELTAAGAWRDVTAEFATDLAERIARDWPDPDTWEPGILELIGDEIADVYRDRNWEAREEDRIFGSYRHQHSSAGRSL